MEFLLEVYQLNKFVVLSFSSFSLNELFFILSSPVFLFNLLSIRFFLRAFILLLGKVHRSSTVLNFWQDCWKFNASVSTIVLQDVLFIPSSIVTFSRNKTALKNNE